MFQHLDTPSSDSQEEFGDKTISTNNHLKINTRLRTSKKPFKCEVCNEAFLSKKALIIHASVHPAEKAYKCQICNNGYSTAFGLKTHTISSHTYMPSKCETCNKIFSSIKLLEIHKKLHTGEQSGKSKIRKKKLSKLHISYIPQIPSRRRVGFGLYECEICNKKFVLKSYLPIHLKSHETHLKCEICNRIFSAKNHLTKHLKSHSVSKPGHCESYINIFATNDTLKSPTEENPFEWYQQLTKHSQPLTGVNPFECEMCNMRFSTKQYLTMHSRLHAGEWLTFEDSDGPINSEEHNTIKLELLHEELDIKIEEDVIDVEDDY